MQGQLWGGESNIGIGIGTGTGKGGWRAAPHPIRRGCRLSKRHSWAARSSQTSREEADRGEGEGLKLAIGKGKVGNRVELLLCLLAWLLLACLHCFGAVTELDQTARAIMR